MKNRRAKQSCPANTGSDKYQWFEYHLMDRNIDTTIQVVKLGIENANNRRIQNCCNAISIMLIRAQLGEIERAQHRFFVNSDYKQ